MNVRMFKPGDKVQRKTGGPIMTIQRYAWKYSPILGWHESPHLIECTWYEKCRYRKEVFHELSLRKTKIDYYSKLESDGNRVYF